MWRDELLAAHSNAIIVAQNTQILMTNSVVLIDSSFATVAILFPIKTKIAQLILPYYSPVQ